MDWEFDEISRKGTVWLRKGAGVDHSRTVSGNTVNFDGQGQVISLVFANPLATMNMSMAGVSIAADDVKAMKNLMQHTALFSKKIAGA